MLNRLGISQRAMLTSSLAVCLSTGISTIYALPASSQILPTVWATVGSIDDLVSYGAGVKFGSAGIEVGTGEEGATGGDFLTFISLPIVSPYIGIGYYSGDEDIAISGGAHLNLGKRLVVGAGYHSVRGPNGQLGIRF